MFLHCQVKGNNIVQDTFLPTFKFLFERMNMNLNQFVKHINAQPLPVETHPPYRHALPIQRTTVLRILSGSIPDPDTLYRIARFGFGLNDHECGLLEDIRYEAYLLAQEERRTTQQMTAVKVLNAEKTTEEIEIKAQENKPKIPDWIYA